MLRVAVKGTEAETALHVSLVMSALVNSSLADRTGELEALERTG